MKCRFLQFILIVSVVFLLPCPALANAPAPPPYIWFTFSDGAAVEGMQFIGCQTALCEKPTLLMQHGTCSRSSCLTTQPVLKAPHRFECAEHTCLYKGASLGDPPLAPYLKLVGQFQNRVRSSQAFITDFRSPIAGYADRHLLVKTLNEELLVLPDRQAMKPSRWEVFGRALAIAEMSELAILWSLATPIAAVFFGWRKCAKDFTIRMLTAIALINLLTFPVVWFFFPSLQPFQYLATRVFGATSLVIAIVFSVALIRLKTIHPKTLIRLFTIWTISLPLVLAIAGVIAFFVSYGESFPSSAGIPSWIALPASEVFAIVTEAWLLSRLSQNNLSFAQASLISVLMNGVSLGLRMALLPPLR